MPIRQRLRTALAVSFAALQLVAAPVAVLAGDFEDELEATHREAFFDSGYHYCDAQVLSVAWGDSIDEAKSHIGWKVTEGSREILDDSLRTARVTAMEAGDSCYYDLSSEFGYVDADALSMAWGSALDETKARMSYKIATGNAGYLTAELAAWAERGEDAIDELGANELDGVEETDLEAYHRSGYGHCDAAALAEHWLTPLEDAKANLGRMWRRGEEEELSTELSAAIEEAQARGDFCWVDTSDVVSRSDAALFAAHWNMDETEALTQLDQELADGHAMEIEALKRELAAQ